MVAFPCMCIAWWYIFYHQVAQILHLHAVVKLHLHCVSDGGDMFCNFCTWWWQCVVVFTAQNTRPTYSIGLCVTYSKQYMHVHSCTEQCLPRTANLLHCLKLMTARGGALQNFCTLSLCTSHYNDGIPHVGLP